MHMSYGTIHLNLGVTLTITM